MTSSLKTMGPRTKRGLPRPCQACGHDFRPKNAKGKFCSEACKKARGRLEAKTGFKTTPDSYVARVPFRSKSANNINGVSGHFRKPRVAAKTGWHVQAGELVFVPMADTAPFSIEECRRFARGHLRLKPVPEIDGDLRRILTVSEHSNNHGKTATTATSDRSAVPA